jgi:hypothetical protein
MSADVLIVVLVQDHQKLDVLIRKPSPGYKSMGSELSLLRSLDTHPNLVGYVLSDA